MIDSDFYDVMKSITNYLVESKIQQMDGIYGKRLIYDHLTSSNLRSQAKDEFIMEYDLPNKKLSNKLVKITAKRLKAHGYNYMIFDHAGKSPHIHIYNIKGLDLIDHELRSIYLSLLIKKYGRYGDYDSDHCFCKNYQIVAKEWRPHFKYGTIKNLIDYRWDGTLENHMEIDLLKTAHLRLQRRIEERNKESENLDDYKWIIGWVMNDVPEYISSMNLTIFKNLAILLTNNEYDKKQIDKILEGMSKNLGRKIYGQMMGWLSWSNQDRRRFSIAEIKQFMQRHDINFKQAMEKWT